MAALQLYGKLGIFAFLLLAATTSCIYGSEVTKTPTYTPSVPQPVPTYTYRIINRYVHDRNAFTEGLAYDNDFLYEGTGLNGSSSIRKVDLKTGNILQIHKIPDQYFGEGITLYKDTLIQLTWKSNIGFIYDKNTFESMSEFSYSTEGWGITFDGKRLIMSDGTSTLHFLDPSTLKTVANIEVKDNNTPITKINELEYVKGKIYANIWQTDKIAIIEPSNGQVSGWIDLSGLLSPLDYSDKVDVLNGIAYDVRADRLFVTGKLWPLLFEIKLVAN